MSINSINKSGQTWQPIERTIPGSGSTIKIVFTTPDYHLNGSITFKATLHMEMGKGNTVNRNFKHRSPITISRDPEQILKERAIDYIRGKIIFLPKKATSLFDKWKKQVEDINNNSKKQEKLKKHVEKLKLSVEILREDRSALREYADAYINLCNAYYKASEYKTALLCSQRLFTIAQQINDQEGIEIAHCNLGNVYHKLGEIERAISHHQEDLRIGDLQNNEIAKGRACTNLGNIYESLSKFQEALEFYKQSLDIALGNPHLHKPEQAYCHMGHAYRGLGEYPEAEEYYKKSLGIAKKPPALNGLGLTYLKQGKYRDAISYFEEALKTNYNQSDKGDVLANLGLAYESLCNYSMALKYHQEDLEIAQKIKNAESEARAYYNLGALYIYHFKKDEEGMELLKKATSIAETIKDLELLGMIFGTIGHGYLFNHNLPDEAVGCYTRQLEIATQLKDPYHKGTAYNDLGNAYTCLEQYDTAIIQYQHLLKISQQIQDNSGEAIAYSNLGHAYYRKKKYPEALKYCTQSIDIYSDLQDKNCQENPHWKISLFEDQYRPYRWLEKTRLQMECYEEALLIADFSRARALVGLLGKRLNIPKQEQLSLEKVQQIAEKFQTAILIYSCDPSDKDKAWCWIISLEGKINFFNLDLTDTFREELFFEHSGKTERGQLHHIDQEGKEIQKVISSWVADIEKDACRGPESDTVEIKQESFEQVVKKWYEILIAPIENLLPQNGERLTIIPDAFLHDLPFALFQDPKGQYLFEKCTMLTVPSVETLIRLDTLDKINKPHRNTREICIVANGEANEDYRLPALEGVKKEGEAVAKFFDKQAPEDTHASIEKVKISLAEAEHIHLACHGLANEKENQHSIFEGALVMADGLLFAEDINKLVLNAELAILTACHSGKGKVYREGSVGLPFALLAAGVSSVIATRWKIFDHATQKIISKFYHHYLGKSEEANPARSMGKPFGQAEALREAMLFAKKEYPQSPKAWGAFFLVGLPGSIQRNHSTSMETKQAIDVASQPKIWTDVDSKLQIHFYLKDGVMTARLLRQNSEGEFKEIVRDFLEKNIKVHMTPPAKLITSGRQIIRRLNQLELEEKTKLLNSLMERKIKINDEELVIQHI